MNCTICGLENIPSAHRGTIDCVNYQRAYIQSLYQEINKLKNELPKGEVFLRCPIGKWNNGKQVNVRLWIEGKPKLDDWIRFQKIIALMESSFDDEFDFTEATEGIVTSDTPDYQQTGNNNDL